MCRRVFILGSTGSIGTSAIDVICHLNEVSPDSYNVVGLAAKTSKDLLLKQAHALKVNAISLSSGTIDYKNFSRAHSA